MTTMVQRFRRVFEWLGPPWLVDTDYEQGKVLYSLGVMQDAFAERTRQSLLARFPGYNAEDALTRCGRDRRITRGLNEFSPTYATRLLRWLTDWRVSGNPFTLIRQLKAYIGSEYPCRIDIVNNAGNVFRSSPANAETYLPNQIWDWDGNASEWARFWVLIYQDTAISGTVPLWSTNGLLGASSRKLGTLGQLGSTMTSDQAQQIKNIIQQWKPAGTACYYVMLVLQDGTIEPDGTWANWHRMSSGEAVPSRYGAARYFHVSRLID
jgi:hypothetical protein